MTAVVRKPDHGSRRLKKRLYEGLGRKAYQLIQRKADEMSLVRRLAGLGPMIEKMITDSGYHTQDMVISLPSGVTVLMDDCSDQKFDVNCSRMSRRGWMSS